MRRRRKRKRRQVSVPVASMGDIAFLLIIFFMLASEFDKDRVVPMRLPTSAQVEKVQETIAVRIDIDKDGNIFLDGLPVSDAAAVGAGVEAILEGTISDDQRCVQFKCDADLTTDVFQPVLQAIAEAGGIVKAVGEEE